MKLTAKTKKLDPPPLKKQIADAAWIGQSSPTDASLQGAAAAAANVASLLTGPVEKLLLQPPKEEGGGLCQGESRAAELLV